MHENSKKEAGGEPTKEFNEDKTDKFEPRTDRIPESCVHFILHRYDQLISLANQKASFLIGIAGVILVTTIAQQTQILKTTECVFAVWLNDIFYMMAGLGLIAVLALSLLVVLPITKSGEIHGRYTSFIAYSSVAKIDVESYCSKLAANDYDYWYDLVRQTHQVAKILNLKFQILGWASYSALVSAVSIMALFILGVI